MKPGTWPFKFDDPAIQFDFIFRLTAGVETLRLRLRVKRSA
jgi:hypothetical protein